MAILPQLGDHDARTAALLHREALHFPAQQRPVLIIRQPGRIHAGHGLAGCAMPAPRLFQRIRNLADRGAQTGRAHRQFQQVAMAFVRRHTQFRKRRAHRFLIARCPNFGQPRNLLLAYRRVVDLARLDLVLDAALVLVHAHDDILSRIDARLLLRGRRFDLQLGPARAHGLRHAAHRFHFLMMAQA
jgi:hypothetical protein